MVTGAHLLTALILIREEAQAVHGRAHDIPNAQGQELAGIMRWQWGIWTECLRHNEWAHATAYPMHGGGGGAWCISPKRVSRGGGCY